MKAVIGGTGGYGAVRMLPYLEPEVFRLHPEVVRRLLRHHRAAPVADAARRAAHLSRTDRGRPHARRRAIRRLASLLTALTHAAARDARWDAASRAPCGRDARRDGSSVGICRSCSSRSARPYEIHVDDAILFLEETQGSDVGRGRAARASARVGLASARRGHRIRAPLARPLGGGRVRGLRARPRLRPRRAGAHGLSGRPRNSEPDACRSAPKSSSSSKRSAGGSSIARMRWSPPPPRRRHERSLRPGRDRRRPGRRERRGAGGVLRQAGLHHRARAEAGRRRRQHRHDPVQDAARDGALLLRSAAARTVRRRPARQARHHDQRLHVPRARRRRRRVDADRREPEAARHHGRCRARRRSSIPTAVEVTRYGEPTRVVTGDVDPRRDGIASAAAGAASPSTAGSSWTATRC